MFKYIFIAIACLSVMEIQAQATMQIHTGTNMQVFDNTQVGVYTNVLNQGAHTTGTNSEILFYGENWTNAITATNPGTGTVQFVQPNTLTTTTSQQTLEGGNNAASFPMLRVNNSSNVILVNNNSKIRDQLDFQTGHMILDSFNLTVGNGNPGSITNYTENRFVVTSADSSKTSGFLIRENFNGAAIEFPVGIAVGDYTPARLTNGGTADDYAVKVFNHVYTRGNNGGNRDVESVGRTWHIQEATVGGSDVELDLQHNTATEGVQFDPNSNYVARHVSMIPNSVVEYTVSEWDYVGSSNCVTNIAPANITTGANVGGAARNIRSGFDDFSSYQYYTVAVCDVNALPVELTYFQTSINEDCEIYADWQTASEMNVSHFELEYSLDGVNYEYIGKLDALNQEIGGNYDYTFQQANLAASNYHYFRLKTMDLDGSFSYSPTTVVNSSDCQTHQTNQDYTIYPNPNQTDRLNIKLPQGFDETQDGLFVITDVLGRTVWQEVQRLNMHQRIFDVNISQLVSGTYFIHFQQVNQRLLAPKKFVVIHE
ncbi:MAG: T9SS type A sorting domain-containing protein [Aureispira sp.]|nr:T9SS type A sorting domain-containing protein [Aureispira sp.]